MFYDRRSARLHEMPPEMVSDRLCVGSVGRCVLLATDPSKQPSATTPIANPDVPYALPPLPKQQWGTATNPPQMDICARIHTDGGPMHV